MAKHAGKLFAIFYIFMLFMILAICASGDTAQNKAAGRAEIASLSWTGSKMMLFLYAPNGTMIPANINNSKIRHVTGPTYDYYLLSGFDYGKYTLEVLPVDVPVKGETFSVVTGPVTIKPSAKNSTQTK